jgi:hypothetical protein
MQFLGAIASPVEVNFGVDDLTTVRDQSFSPALEVPHLN